MSDVYVLQPIDAETELLRDILPDDTEIPVVTANSLVNVGRVRLGEEEYVSYYGIGTGPVGEPVLQNCKRGLDREKGGSEAKAWLGGSRVEQIPWTTVEKTGNVQPPTEDQVGRLVVFRQAGYDDTLNTGITLADGTPVWVELSSRPIDTEENPYSLAWVSNHFAGGTTANGVVDGPHDIGVDSSGNVFVIESSNTRIQKFTSALAYSTKVGTVGSGNGQFKVAENGLSIGADNNVYAMDKGNYRVQKFSNALAYTTQWGVVGAGGINNGSEGNFDFWDMRGIATDSSNNVYVMDRSYCTIKKYNATGTYQTRWGSYGAANGQFGRPDAIAVDPSNNVWVADVLPSGVARIQKFSNTGTHLATYIVGGTGNGQFQYIMDMRFSSDGKLWATDPANRRIQVIDTASGFKWLASIGSAGTGNGQFGTTIFGICPLDTTSVLEGV